MPQVNANLDMNNAAKVINLPNPSSAQDAATKAYVDSVLEGLAWKDNARVASTANINLASPGSSIDGVTMASGDRVLVKNQTSQPENGLYIWNGAATTMTRANDASTSDELESAVVTVDEGTSAGATFRQTQVNFTLGSGNVVWTSFGTSAPSASETIAGIAEIATQAETNTGSDDLRIVTPLKLATWSGRSLKFSQDIGDGSATSYTVTHNLGSRDLHVQVRRNSGNYDQIIVDIEYTTANSVTIKFAAAPASNAFRVIIVG
jgi:hypothetical protein